MSHQHHCPIHGEHSSHCCHKCHEVCHHENHHAEAEECDPAKRFLELADEAWMEVLKEKIKDHLRATKGAHLDELAKIISEANQKRWQNKMAAKQEVHEFREKMCGFFSQKQK